MARVDVYFSMLSPWAYLGHAPFMALASKHQLEIGWRPVPLMDVFGETGGQPLAKRPIQRRRYRDVELQRWATKRRQPVNLRPKFWPFNPTLADCVALALLGAGKNPAGYIGAAMRGVWAEDRDLSSPETIADLVGEQGFDPRVTLETAREGATIQIYEASGKQAIANDVFGSPSYVLDGEVFWGQDRLELLDDMLTSVRPRYDPLE